MISCVSWLVLLSHVYYVCSLVILCGLSYVGAGVCVCLCLVCFVVSLVVRSCLFVAVRRVGCLLSVFCPCLFLSVVCCVSLLRIVVVR